MIMWLARLLGQLAVRVLTKKLPWTGGILGWLWTETPMGAAVDSATALFIGCTIPVAVLMTCVWLWMRAQDEKRRQQWLDRSLPRPRADPPPREDDDPDPDVDPTGPTGNREAVAEGIRA